MTAAAPANPQPPEAEQQFDLGSTDDSLERMIELFERHGDTYRVFSPTRGSYTYVIHHPDDVKRVLVSNHRNYTKGLALDLRHRPRSPVTPARRQPVRPGDQGSGTQPAVRLQIPLAHQAGRRAHGPATRRGRGAL